MLSHILAKKWGISRNSTYKRLQSIGVSIDQMRVLDFQELDKLFKRSLRWIAKKIEGGYHFYFKKSGVKFSVMSDADLPQLLRHFETCRRQYYVKKKPWFVITEIDGGYYIKSLSFNLTVYAKDVKYLFRVVTAHKRGNVYEE